MAEKWSLVTIKEEKRIAIYMKSWNMFKKAYCKRQMRRCILFYMLRKLQFAEMLHKISDDVRYLFLFFGSAY